MISFEFKDNLTKIAEQIISSEQDSAWEKALLKIAVIGNSVDFNLNFKYSEEYRNLKLKSAFSCAKEVLSMHEKTKQSTVYKKWDRAIFTLYHDNKFEIEYIWDQELQDEVDKYKPSGASLG